MNFRTFAAKWGLPMQAVLEWESLVGVMPPPASAHGDRGSEERVTSEVLLEASALGYTLHRNNRGVMMNDKGQPVRFGLCNDSAKLGQRFRSSDRIGIRPVTITDAHVGHTIGQYVSIEMKRSDWVFDPNDEHDVGQLRWINLINDLGGYAKFVNRVGMLCE